MAGGEQRTATHEDRSPSVIPSLVSGSPWRVVDMRIVEDRAMRVRFLDGVEGTVRFGPTFFRGVFAHLIDPTEFAQAAVEMGAVTWPGELDLAPDRMHDDILREGTCVLGAN